MSKSTTEEADRRRSPRFVCGGHAQLNDLPSSGIILRGKLRDLSLGGCCLDTQLPPDFGSRAEIVVRVNASSFRALGEVRAIRGRSSTGLEFVQFSARGKDMLAELIADLARRNAAIHKLRAGNRDWDGESLRQKLDRIQANGVSGAEWTPIPQLNLRSSELLQAAEHNSSYPAALGEMDLSAGDGQRKSRVAETGSTIVTIDIFG